MALSTAARWAASGVARFSGGAAKAMRPEAPSSGRSGTTPTAHSWRTTPASRGWPPWANQAWQVPSVGWPANGNSPPGVKMRTR